MSNSLTRQQSDLLNEIEKSMIKLNGLGRSSAFMKCAELFSENLKAEHKKLQEGLEREKRLSYYLAEGGTGRGRTHSHWIRSSE